MTTWEFHTFWTDWELWLQMTFILGCFIVLVMMAGFIKLFLINRRIKKFVKIESEKKARVKELRNSGLGPPKAEVPFGVRAIQKGVEVDGIWISQPATPATETASFRASKLFGPVDPPRVRAPSDGGRIPIKGAVEVRILTPRTSPTYGDLAAQARTPGLQSIYKPSRAPARPIRPDAFNNGSHADTLRSLEGSQAPVPVSKAAPQTYMPSRSEPPAKSAHPPPIMEYDEYIDEDVPTDPFDDPEPSERDLYDEQPSPTGHLYTSHAGSSSGNRRGNAGYAPLHSAGDIDDIDLERGNFSEQTHHEHV